MKFSIRDHPKVVKYGIPVLIILLILGLPAVLMSTEHQREITVDEKWIKYHNDEAKYLVSDIDGNVYSVEDMTLLLKFDASNRYARLKVGESYTVTIVGWKVPLTSMYPNIIELEEV